MAKKNKENKILVATRVSATSRSNKTISPSKWINEKLLQTLKCTYDKYDAIDLIVDNTPDGKTAMNIYTNFVNSGGKFEFHNVRTNKRVIKYDNEFNERIKNIGKMYGGGLSNLGDALTRSAYTRTGISLEVVVEEDLSDIKEVLVIDPKTFREFEYDENDYSYKIYQKREDNKRINLYDGNFVFIPTQPNIANPCGTVKFEPAILTMAQYYTTLQNTDIIQKKYGHPVYVYTLDEKAMLESAHPTAIQSQKDREALVTNNINNVSERASSVSKTSDIVTTSSMKVDMLGGNNGAGMDMRAWLEPYNALICNAFQLLPVLMSRQEGGSYALGAAELKPFMDSIESIQGMLVKAFEYIANMWARTHGYQVYAKYIPNPIDLQKELDKWSAQIKKLEFYRKSEEYGYISKDVAAQNTNDVEKADNNNSQGIYQYTLKDFRLASNSGNEDIEQPTIEENENKESDNTNEDSD